jgi:triphosphoribosyl-dephospho-CoA synthase
VARSPLEVPALVQLACLLEASAFKPGNVSPGKPFHNMSYEDFLFSAVAIGPAFSEAGTASLGQTIERALGATRRVTSANTNLGLVLLLAPLAKAASGESALRVSLKRILRQTTVEDARQVYAAIGAAQPGGLGEVEQQDLGSAPTVTLREVMALAGSRDAIASEYVTDFETTFSLGAPALRGARAAGLGWGDAVTETSLTLLAAQPDSLIARKSGSETAKRVSDQAAAVLKAGGVRTAAGLAGVAAFDADLRDPQNSRNPGTTADLTAAAIFAVLWEDG